MVHMKDLHSNIGVALAVIPATLTATSTSAAIDLQGFNSACAVVSTGAVAGSGDYTASLTECDTLGGTYTAVAASDLLGEFIATLAADSVYKVGYVGNKRFIKAVVTKNSGTSIIAGVTIIKGNASSAPVA
jgi:hypothetical protein